MDKIITYTGERVDLFNPDPATIKIEDIAHALSMQCRFGGHTRRFYSVAQHCVYVSRLVSQPNKLAALLHDASEAYIGDIIRPIRREIRGYDFIEFTFMAVIAKKFGFKIPLPDEVTEADNKALRFEMSNAVRGDFIIGLSQTVAEQVFLNQFKQLTAQQS